MKNSAAGNQSKNIYVVSACSSSKPLHAGCKTRTWKLPFFLLFNLLTMERIFNIRDKFIVEAQAALDIIKKEGKINNFSEFEKDSLENGQVIRRLTKTMGDEGRLPLVLENFSRVPDVIEFYDLNLQLDSNNKIDYTDKSQLSTIILLFQDAFYESYIAKRKGIDDN
ncbi:Kiwa anti-phage protein KwaB-like domain-containing protein [Listeria aquatica]|uniref:Kiwa anti-phage protein KwaB-like domain-containing protein n=1 Tax=Listeria aquatica TaxID=1494960 RepID=UPI0031F5854F